MSDKSKNLQNIKNHIKACNSLSIDFTWKQILNTPFKNSKKENNTTLIDYYFFNHGFIFVMFDRYHCKACLFAFLLMPYLLWLFHWGVCRVNLGQCEKWEVAKFDGIVRRWYFMFCVQSVMRSCLTEIHRNKTSCWISNIGAILQYLSFDIAPNLLALHTFQWSYQNK